MSNEFSGSRKLTIIANMATVTLPDKHQYAKADFDNMYMCYNCMYVSGTDDEYYGNSSGMVSCQDIFESGILDEYPGEPIYGWKYDRSWATGDGKITLMPKSHVDLLQEVEDDIQELRQNMAEYAEEVARQEQSMREQLAEKADYLESLILNEIGTDNIFRDIWRSKLDLARKVKRDVTRGR